jgi:hypothetical protein
LTITAVLKTDEILHTAGGDMEANSKISKIKYLFLILPNLSGCDDCGNKRFLGLSID